MPVDIPAPLKRWAPVCYPSGILMSSGNTATVSLVDQEQVRPFLDSMADRGCFPEVEFGDNLDEEVGRSTGTGVRNPDSQSLKAEAHDFSRGRKPTRFDYFPSNNPLPTPDRCLNFIPDSAAPRCADGGHAYHPGQTGRAR
jgi:hypothetical protein